MIKKSNYKVLKSQNFQKKKKTLMEQSHNSNFIMIIGDSICYGNSLAITIFNIDEFQQSRQLSALLW